MFYVKCMLETICFITIIYYGRVKQCKTHILLVMPTHLKYVNIPFKKYLN